MAELSYVQRIGHRIRRKREIVGKSQREVAEAIQMGAAQYSRLEQGAYKSIRFDQLTRLADVLLTSTDYLLLRSDDMGLIPPEHCPEEARVLVSVSPLPTTTLVTEDGQ